MLRSAAGAQSRFERNGEEELWSEAYRNNAHLVDRITEPADGFVPQASNHLLYYDAASLYPSSGKDGG